MRLCYLICLLGALVGQCLAKSRIGATEKIWFWYAYQIAWKLDGPVQNWILPFLNPDRTTSMNHGNRGSGPDSMLAWPEFVQCLCQMPRGQRIPPAPSDDGSNFEDVVDALWALGYGSALGTLIVFGKRENSDPLDRRFKEETYNDEKYLSLTYLEMIQRIAYRLEHARIRDENKITGELTALQTLTDMVLRFRELDTKKFLGADVAKTFFLGNADRVHYETIQDADNPEETAQVIEVKATAKDPRNAADLQRAFPTAKGPDGWRRAFGEWCDLYGSNASVDNFSEFKKDDPPYTHFQAIVCWRQARNALNRTVEALKSPMGRQTNWNYDDPNRPQYS
ncbi:hypothetical protein PG987_007218 [Apiospora arundinis]